MELVVAYASTYTQTVGKRDAFWTALDRVVKGEPEHEHPFVLMDADARTGRRGAAGLESEECKVLGAYDRETLSENGERLFFFPNNHIPSYKSALHRTGYESIKATVRTKR